MLEWATVKKIEKNKATITLTKKTSCEECDICKFSDNKCEYDVKTNKVLKVGESVPIEIVKTFNFQFLQVLIPVVVLVSVLFITINMPIYGKIIGIIVASMLSILTIVLCEVLNKPIRIKIVEENTDADNK